MSKSLTGRICVVTGATRGIGKGIALQLGQAGATVYITGRTSVPGGSNIAGSLQEAAQEIESRGGKCIPVICDHSKDEEIKLLFEQIDKEQSGRLDVLINNAYSGVRAIGENEGKAFWESSVSLWDDINKVGLRNHYICSVYAAKMMVPRRQGLIVNISSPGGISYLFNVPYGVGKEACDRMAIDCARELKKNNVTFLSLWPGFVKTETIQKVLLDSDSQKMLSESRKKFAANYEFGETPEYSGKCISHLIKDPRLIQKSGKIHLTTDLGEEYGFTDINDKKPVNLRSISFLLRTSGHEKLASYIPVWLKIPKWLLVFCLYRF